MNEVKSQNLIDLQREVSVFSLRNSSWELNSDVFFNTGARYGDALDFIFSKRRSNCFI